MSKLSEILDGYGLEEVPREIAKDTVCQVCMAKWPGKLYTPKSSNLREYARQCDEVRMDCYCRFHVLRHYGDES